MLQQQTIFPTPDPEDEFRRDLICGGKAGFCAGTFVAPFEFLKVTIQARGGSIRAALTDRKVLENMGKAVPTFALIFGTVCALEFSVNDRIRQHYGAGPGLLASGFTGAAFLTGADHLMYRQHNGQNLFSAVKQLAGRKLFTGLFPMMIRESIFIANVAYLGPATGKAIQRWSGQGLSEAQSDFTGRIVSGLFTTLISQPFDVLARSLQMNFLNNRSQSISDCLKEMQNTYKSQGLRPWQHPLLRGALPRLFLAASGGAVAGGLYDHFKGRY